MKALLSRSIGVCALLAMQWAQAAQPPDLTGIWGWDPEQQRGAGRAVDLWPPNPPYTKEAKAKVDAYRALVEPTGDSPGGWCLGSGMPGSILGSGGYPMEIIQRPEQITIIQEEHNELRRIYIGGRKVDDKDLIPTRNGYSTGKWEGDTLVVETISLKEGIDQRSPHSDQAKIVERYKLTKDAKGRKILTAQVTVTDPQFYTQPVTVTKNWVAVENGRMLDYECNEPAWEEHLQKLAEAAKKEEKK
jgi:hypothetical protein